LQQTIHSVHDVQGKRIAEYLFDENTNASSLIREYIWANDMLVGVFGNGQMYFVRTDHIGRPGFSTATTGAVVWEASYDPFGGVVRSSGRYPELRFPGQWFQTEAGLHQKWTRDYDPACARTTAGCRQLRMKPDSGNWTRWLSRQPGATQCDQAGRAFAPSQGAVASCLTESHRRALWRPAIARADLVIKVVYGAADLG
jgi:hypothetical protein